MRLPGDVRKTVKSRLQAASFRVLLALAALGSSALVLEAGRRWW